MKLVGMLDSPFVRRTAISLSELGFDFEHEPVSVFSGANDFKAINPVVRAPTLLLDDGIMLMDSNVIIEHFEQAAPVERSLWPRGEPIRSRCAAVLGLALAACDKTVQLVYERSLRPAEKQHARWDERVSGQVAVAFRLLDERLDPALLWLADDRLTQAGLTLAVTCNFTRQLFPELWAAGGFSRLQSFSESAESLPVFGRWPHSGPGTAAKKPSPSR